MILVDFLGWWYTHGYLWAIEQFFVVFAHKISQFFSILDLSKTLFAPFRQDALQGKGASISIKFQIFFGNILSRFFGFIIRTALIFVGVLLILLDIAVGFIAVSIWLLIPLMPIIAILLMVANGVNL